MRLPLSKVYRAFPELDRFSDEQCRGWQRLANQYWPWKRVGVICLAVVAFPVVWTVTIILVSITAAVVAEGVSRRNDITLNDVVGWTLAGIAVSLPILAAAVASFSIRDWWARRCLRRFIDDRVCGCGYSLLGLPEEKRENGVILHCPECGTHHRLNTQTGLTAPHASD